MLRKQLVPIQFGALDEKTESKALAPGGMTRVVNAERNKSGRYDKRTGYSSLSNVDASRSSITGTESLGTTGREMFQSNGSNVYGYVAADDNFVDRGDLVPVTVKTRLLQANLGNTVTAASAASSSDYTMVVHTVEGSNSWTSSNNYYVYATVIDNATGETLVSGVEVFDATLSTTPPNAQVVYLSGPDKFWVIYNDSTNIRLKSWSGPQGPTTFSLQRTIAGRSSTYTKFKAIAYSTTEIVVAYCDGSNVDIELRSGTTMGLDDSDTVAGLDVKALALDDNGNLYCFYDDSSAGIDVSVLNTSFNIAASSQVTTDSTEGNVTAHSSGSTSVRVFWNDDNPFELWTGSVNSSGTVSSKTEQTRNYLVFSDPFEYDSTWYLTLLYESDVQPTYFVVRSSDLKIIAKIAPKNGPSSAPDVCAAVGSFSSTRFAIPILKAIGLNTDGSTAVTRPGGAVTDLEFKTENFLPHVSLGDHALIAGGYLAMYDGSQVVENGFHVYPEITSASGVVSGSGSPNLDNGTYQWRAVYEWADANGKIHRSAPSPAVTETTTGSENAVSLSLKLMLSDKDDVNVVFFRTLAGGTTFYRLPFINLSNGGTAAIDGTNDSDIEDNEILYTQGGELENEQPPACGHVALYKNRVWVTDLEDGSRSWYSKLRINNDDPNSFNESLALSVGDAERVKASQALDDKLVFFKESQLLYTYGEGPDNTGAGGVFAEAVDVNFDGGIAEPDSLVKFPQGLIFKHQRGFYAMGGDLNPQYIGKSVEDFNSLTVTSAVLIPSKNQIRWTHSAGSILAFDYYHQQWYEYSDLQCSGGTIRGGKHVVASSNSVYQQDDAVWEDGSSSYNFLVQTGWISLGGLSGFKRVYKLFFECEYKSNNDLTITVDMEQDGTVYTDTYSIDASSITSLGSNTFRYEVQLSRQKCSSIRVKIEDVNLAVAGNTEQGMNLISMTMLAGLKVGGPKYASAKQIG